MGILILVLLAIGAFVVARFLIRWLLKMSRKLSGRTTDYTAALTGQVEKNAKTIDAQNKVRTVRVGRYNSTTFAQEDTPWDDLPKYKGETGWFGLPKYRDVIVPEKYNYYATVVYMDSPVKQYFYDLMAGWKNAASYTATEGRIKVWGSFLFFPSSAALAGVSLYLILGVVTVVVLLFVFWGFPSGTKAARACAATGKDFTADDIRQVYRELAESREREDEMTRAFRRSGIGHRW